MSQRNPNNDRYKEGGKKGVAKKMSGRAKLKSSAGSSVYVSTKKEKPARSKSKGKDKGLSEKERQVIEAGNEAMNDYNHFRNVWIGLIVVAIIGVLLSFVSPRVMTEGGALAGLAQYRLPVQTAGLVAGYAALIAAFIVDWRKIRPVRKAQGVARRKESRKERAHREAAEAEKAASKKSLFGRKKS